MALVPTVTEIPGKWAARLTATGASGDVLWIRDESGHTTEVGTGVDIVDRLVPLNTEVYYNAVDDVASEIAGPITINADTPILASSMTGAALEVVVIAQQPQSWQARSVWHPIMDRIEGPIVSIFDAEWRAGTLVLDLGRDRDLRGNLIEMLFVGDPLILRATCPDRVDDLTFLPLRWSDPYVTEGQWSGPQRMEIEYQSVAAEPAAFTPVDWTYDDVLSGYATYNDVLNSYATYTDLLANTPS